MVEKLILNGEVIFDQEKVAQVFPVLGGTIVESTPQLGDYVRKGDVLAVIRSGDAADLDKQLISSEQAVALAERVLKSTEETYSAGISSEKDVMQARQEMKTARAEWNKQKATSELYHLKGNSTYRIVSPNTGFIIEKKISPGMQIRGDQQDRLFLIGGLDDVWVMADVYESDINKVRTGDPVEVTTLTYKDKVYEGTIDRIAPSLDMVSKTMSVRIRLNNKDKELKPGMYTNVIVNCQSVRHKLPAVDPKSVIFENGKYYVVTLSSDRRMRIREVEVAKMYQDICYLLSGIDNNDVVVLKNALLVYNELK